jgi:hypothetical protein
MHQPLTSVNTSLRIQSEEVEVSLSNDAEGNLCISLKDFSLFSRLPLNKWRAFRLLLNTSNRIANSIVIEVKHKKWLKITQGKIRIHHWGLTFQSLFFTLQ